ncbi:MAG: glycoside hydrolase family 2 [Chloroflexi bacterium]|nr:glycoside hydrolase family 2 [Chloroflexota bacterium]
MHPTPQFRRSNWLDLGGPWGFAYDDADVGLDQGWAERPECFDRQIQVPFPPESAASGIHDPSEHPVVWYRRTMRLDDVVDWQPGSRLLLHFGAVDYEARVWVNGLPIGRHEGGHVPFALDITEALRAGEQVIVVRALDRPRDLSQPRGKQFWEPEPRRIWYHRTTGIWQPVWAEAVGRTHIADVRWLPDPARGVVGLRVQLNREPETPLHLRLRLSLRGDLMADDRYLVQRQETRREIGLEPAVLNIGRRKLLWAPGHPNLVDAQLILENADGSVLDEVHSYVGLRSVSATDRLFLLNGIPSYLRLVLSQGYWPESHLAAPSDEAIRHEVELIKALGFNGVRNHQKVEDPRFLYECDRQGLYVWSEMASAYVFSEVAVERFTREWLEVVRRDVSHPSIVTWVPFNESWGLPNLAESEAQRSFVRAIHELTLALDPSRPVIGNDGWEHVVADVWGIHDYALDGPTLRERYGSLESVERTLTGRPQHHRIQLDGAPRAGQPIVLSEFGGISFHAEPGRPWFGYGSVANADELLAKYTELVDAVLDSPALAGFCYTQLTDTEQEANGLLDAARVPKVNPERLAAVTRRASRAIPGDLVSAAQEAGIVTAFGSASAG